MSDKEKIGKIKTHWNKEKEIMEVKINNLENYNLTKEELKIKFKKNFEEKIGFNISKEDIVIIEDKD